MCMQRCSFWGPSIWCADAGRLRLERGRRHGAGGCQKGRARGLVPSLCPGPLQPGLGPPDWWLPLRPPHSAPQSVSFCISELSLTGDICRCSHLQGPASAASPWPLAPSTGRLIESFTLMSLTTLHAQWSKSRHPGACARKPQAGSSPMWLTSAGVCAELLCLLLLAPCIAESAVGLVWR